LTPEEESLAKVQLKYGQDYNKETQINLTDIITNYVDLSS